MEFASLKNRVAFVCAKLLLVSALFSGCVCESGEDGPCDEKAGQLTMRFSLPFSPVSRVDNQGHEEVESSFPSFEDFINPKDIGIFVFLGEGESAPLVKKYVKLSEVGGDAEASMIGYGTQYVISLRMSYNQLKEANPGIDIRPNSTDVIKFRVVVLANERTSRTSSNDYLAYDNCKTYVELINTAYVKALSLGTSYYPESGEFKGTIPMFGMCVFDVKAEDLYYTRPDDVFDLGSVHMLRSLAKVCLIDKTTKNERGYPKISCDEAKSGLNYYYRMAYNLPFNAIEYRNGYQVDNIHLCTTVRQEGYTKNIKNTDQDMPEVIYMGYCPEQKIELQLNGTVYPYFTFHYLKSATGTLEERVVNLSGIPLADGSGYGLVRNHIYTIEVTNEATARSGDGDLRVRVKTTPW